MRQGLDFRLGWLGAVLLVIAIQGLTLRIEPLILQDEVQVLDFGRAILDPGTDWAMSWNVSEDRAVLHLPYPGVALQEWAYRLLAPSHLGPRWLSLLAAVLAAGCALGWLRARNVPPAAALVLSLVFLIDPIFSATYRGGRVDAWAFAAIFAACWLLRGAYGGLPDAAPKRRLILAGLLATLAPFLWPAAAMLLPLVLIEFAAGDRLRPDQARQLFLPRLLAGLSWLALGGLACLVLLSPPILLDPEGYLSGFRTSVEIQARAATIRQPLHHVFAAHDPAIAFSAILALLVRREIGLLVGLVVAILMMNQTMVYPPRVMYLLPYLLAIIGGACQALAARPPGSMRRLLPHAMLLLALLWNTAVVLVVRPVAAWQQQPTNHADAIFTVFQEAMETGPYRVLMEEWHGYYAGRAMGWLMYRAGSPVKRESYRAFLTTMDYIVVAERPLQSTTRDLALESGFVPHATLRFPQGKPVSLPIGASGYVLPAQDYPTLVVYRNPSGVSRKRLVSGSDKVH